MRHITSRSSHWLAALVAMGLATPALAAYPEKPITLIVPWAAGGGTDATARIIAKSLNCEQGESVTPCLACSACDEIERGADLDVVEIDGASHNGVDSVEYCQSLLTVAVYHRPPPLAGRMPFESSCDLLHGRP